MMHINKALIQCVRVLLIIHAKDMYKHSIYDLGLAISLWGWKVVVLVSLVSSSDQRLDQNVLRN